MPDLRGMHGSTVVLGASMKPERYAHQAVHRLLAQGHAVVAVGRRAGSIGMLPILTDLRAGTEVDTVTVYLSPANQAAWANRLLHLKPRRVIFNPGAENPELARALRSAGIEVAEACTLVLLATGQY